MEHSSSLLRPPLKLGLWLLLIAFYLGLPGGTNPAAFLNPFPPRYGIASWYSRHDRGIRWYTASGEKFDDTKATCASWNFPFGTYLKITNVSNGKFVICRVNDRGPLGSLNRTVDLTRSSFEKIADPERGLAQVTIAPLARIGRS